MALIRSNKASGAGNIFDDAKVIQNTSSIAGHGTGSFTAVSDGLYGVVMNSATIGVGTTLRASGITSQISIIEIVSGSSNRQCAAYINSVSSGVITFENGGSQAAYGILFKIG